MNAGLETVSKTSDDKAEATHQERRAEPACELVELGKVSDTRGGWLGSKADNGFGFTVY